MPVAYYFMAKWLENYAYKYEIDINMFIAAGMMSIIIAGISISYQAFKAANANPVETLKYE